MNLVDLIRLGFHGFAAAMLLMGFRLLKTVINKQDDSDHTENSRLELKLLLKSVRNFLLISLVFFVLGVTSELLKNQFEKNQVNEMTVMIQPDANGVIDKGLLPTLLKEDEGIPVKFNLLTSTFKDSVKIQ